MPRGSLPGIYRVFAATSLPEALVIVHASMRHLVRGKPSTTPADVSSVRARVLDVALDMQERRCAEAVRVPRRLAIDNVFLQLGFSGDEADELMRRADLIAELRCEIRRRPNQDRANALVRAVFDGDIDAVNVEPLQQMLNRLGTRDLTTW